MSTSDQQGQGPLTRKQLREIRLTGSTPVITAEEAAAAATPPVPPVPPVPRPVAPVEQPPAPVHDEDADAEPTRLTRRQMREQEQVRTASVPVSDVDAEAKTAEPAEVVEEPSETPETPETPVELVTGVPRFTAITEDASDDDDADEDATGEAVAAPVSAASATEFAVDDIAVSHDVSSHDAAVTDDVAGGDLDVDDEPVHDDVLVDDDAVIALGLDSGNEASEADASSDVDDDDDELSADERPTVNPAFGQGILGEAVEHKPFAPSFDELLTVGDSTGSQHIAPSALIFTPAPGEGSLSGPVASTGEVLVTGSYELPQGLGSRGHAHGTTDGKEIDAVLIDGELPPASSPTPIAASSAVSTSKSAGEVIRPPAPEKGNKLMLTLAITAGGLALALAVALIIAFSTNVL